MTCISHCSSAVPNSLSHRFTLTAYNPVLCPTREDHSRNILPEKGEAKSSQGILTMLLSADHHPSGGVVSARTNGTGGHDPTPVSTSDLSVESSIPSHPLGIKPLGNRYLYDGPVARKSIGSLQGLPDEMLAQLLEFLDQRSVRLLGYTCRFLYAFSLSDDTWKTLFLE